MIYFVAILYQLLLTLLLPLGLLWWCAAALFSRRHRVGWTERLGFWPKIERGSVWIHGASLGEIRAVAPLIRALKDRKVPLLVTATSSTGRGEAENLLSGWGRALLLPLDHFLPLWLAFRRAKPSALVIAETELWPGFLIEARASGVPIIIVTGRISNRTFPRYMKFRWLVSGLLGMARTIQAQSPLDAERYLALGAEPSRVFIGGNMKFDLPPPDTSDPLAVSLRRAKAGGWRVVVAGSVHPGEARTLFEGAALLREKGEKLGLVVAPRHLEKTPDIEQELARQGGRAVRWSELSKPVEAAIIQSFANGDAIMVDRVGMLARLYGGGEVAFVGGSLVPIGGHNLLEPLRWGVPVVFGPHMGNAADVRDEVLRRGLGTLVTGPESFSDAVSKYLNDEKLHARVKKDSDDFFEANRGALMMAVEAVADATARDAEKRQP